MVQDEVDHEEEAGEPEPIDLDEIDPEAWRPGPPGRPPLSLLAWFAAIPVASLVLHGIVAERAAREDPSQAGLIATWQALIFIGLMSGLAIAFAVPVIARVVRGRDRWILAILELGFRIGVIIVTILLAINGILVAAFIAGLEYALLGNVLPGVSGTVALGVLAGITAFAVAGLGSFAADGPPELAIRLARADAPRLFDRIDALAAQVGVEPPPEVILGVTMRWWVAGGHVRLLDGEVSGRTLHVSLPELAILSEPEVEAILAHELAHLRSGELELGARQGIAFGRVESSIRALRTEATGIARIAAAPCLRWLEFALDTIATPVGERRRVSEAAADAIAASAVGPGPFASGLVVSHAALAFEDEWRSEVGRAVDGEIQDPTRGFAVAFRRGLVGVSAADVIVDALHDLEPLHPALLTRLRGVDRQDVALEPTRRPALKTLLANAAAVTRRLVDRLRPADSRDERLALNEPHLTPGIVGWLVAGVGIGAILAYRWATAPGPVRDLPVIAATLAGAWLLFPILYPWLQREVIIDRDGVRSRSWWSHWLGVESGRFGWSELPWSPTMKLEIGFEDLATLSDGDAKVRIWTGIWSKGERQRMHDALSERGVEVTFTSGLGKRDPERHAVVYYLPGPDRFLLPVVKRQLDGSLVEVRPVKVVAAGPLRFAFALIDRLHDPIEVAMPSDRAVDEEHLAALAGISAAELAGVTRLEIAGDREIWTIAAGDGVAWEAPRDALKHEDLDEVIYELLGIEVDPRIRLRRTRSVDDATRDETSG